MKNTSLAKQLKNSKIRIRITKLPYYIRQYTALWTPWYVPVLILALLALAGEIIVDSALKEPLAVENCVL